MPKHLILPNCRDNCENGMKTGCHLGGSKINQIITDEWSKLKEKTKEENEIKRKESSRLGVWGTFLMYLFGIGAIGYAGYYVVQKYGLEVILDRFDWLKVTTIIYAEEKILPWRKKIVRVLRKKAGGKIPGFANSKSEKVV